MIGINNRGLDSPLFLGVYSNIAMKGGYVMTTEAMKKGIARYDAKNTVQIKLKLNKGTDKDILDKLEASGNKQGYIKNLIRKDINTNL